MWKVQGTQFPAGSLRAAPSTYFLFKLDDFHSLRYDNRVKEVKKRVFPHRIARIAKTVWGDARESGDRAQGAAGSGIYRRDGRYGEKDGQRAGRIQIDRT